jgi:hypothetical protein
MMLEKGPAAALRRHRRQTTKTDEAVVMGSKDKMRKRRAVLKRLGLPAKFRGSLKDLVTPSVTPLSTDPVTPSVTPVTPSAPRGISAVKKTTRSDVPDKVWARLKELGKPPTARTTVIQVIGDLYGDDGKQAALKTYDRALPRRIVDRMMPTARQWAGLDAAPYETYDAVRELIELYGPDRLDRFEKWFDSVDQQLGGEDKFSQLLKLRERLRKDRYDLPKRRLQRGKSPAIVEKILTLMRRDPKRFWTTSKLANRFGLSVKAMWHLTRQMEARGLIVLVDEGRRLWGLPEAGIPTRKTKGGQIIEKLIAVEEMRFSALARAIGVSPEFLSTPVKTLRRNGVLPPADRHRDPNKRPPLRLSAEARSKIERGEVIRDQRGAILWAPVDAGQK